MCVGWLVSPLEFELESVYSKNGSLEKTKTILFSAKGNMYSQEKAGEFKIYWTNRHLLESDLMDAAVSV